jgi:hypothetical protein
MKRHVGNLCTHRNPAHCRQHPAAQRDLSDGNFLQLDSELKVQLHFHALQIVVCNETSGSTPDSKRNGRCIGFDIR